MGILGRILESRAEAAIRERIIGHLTANGQTPTQAAATVHAIGSGLGPILQWVIQNAPTIYADVAFVLALLGIPLPPLPPLP